MFISKSEQQLDPRELMGEKGLLVARGVDFSSDMELINWAAGLSRQEGDLRDKLLHWEFGPLMEMSYQKEAKNYLFSEEAVPFHWDGAFHREPSWLLFHCTESTGDGGETLFSDTQKLWEGLSLSEKKECLSVRLTFETDKLAHYGGKITVPLVQRHPRNGGVILRMAEEVNTSLNPVKLTIEGSHHAQEICQHLQALLYSEAVMVAHRWRKGDLVLCDNFTYLHGRRPLGKNILRKFKRVQIL